MISDKARAWLMANRTSARLAFVLRLAGMAINSVMGLLWTPMFLKVLGDVVYGTFLSFQGATRLAGLGDFGLSGAVAVRTGQMIGRGEEDRLRPFLASARTALLLMSIFLGAMFCILSPWLPQWLDFKETPAAGSLTALFVVGGVTITVGLIAGYLNGLNAAYATLTWPIIPLLLLTQAALALQWLVAKTGLPLWTQALVLALGGCVQAFVLWRMLKAAHPWLGEVFPLRRDMTVWRDLLRTSGWVYLYSLGSIIFTATDRLLINAGSAPGFGPAGVLPYSFNYKLCELVLQVVLTATYIGQSKINMWIADPAEETQERAREAVQRLLIFQSFLGTCSALGYLALNNSFVEVWVGKAYQVTVVLQWAFALNVAVTAGGDAGIQVAGLCGRNGLRTAGIAIGLTAALNLGLSFISMKMGSVLGIAYATVVAQTLLSLSLGCYTCRHLKLSYARWIFRSWLLPMLVVTTAAGCQSWIGSGKWSHAGVLVVFLLLGMAHGRLAGVSSDFVRHEWSMVVSFLPSRFRRGP